MNSISGHGNCYDNAVAERVFGLLKRERVHRRQYQTRSILQKTAAAVPSPTMLCKK